LTENERIVVIFKGRFDQIFKGITGTQLLGAISATRNSQRSVLDYVKSIIEKTKEMDCERGAGK